MRLIITGSPGTGKTAAAKELGKRLKCRVLNEKEFAVEKGIGKWDPEENELAIPPEKFGAELNRLLEKEENIILEGHLLCELRLKADYVIVLRLHPGLLESRLEQRNYSAEKVQDNVFCEGIDYCKKRALKNYGKKVVEVHCEKYIKYTVQKIIEALEKRGETF